MRQVSGVDAAFLYGETPSWHMHVSAVMVLDPSTCPHGWDIDRFKSMLAERLPGAPQFRWKLMEVPFGLDRPVWVDDPDFDLDYHVRRIGVPAPGGPEQLGNLVGELVAIKLDRRRPLWEMWIIEGLADGKLALLSKIHHSIIDGISGSELATILLDAEPDPPPRPAPDVDPMPVPVPTSGELLARSALSIAGMPWRIARLAQGSINQGLAFAGFRRQAAPPPIPFQAPRTSFNTELTPHRRFAYSSVPLADVKAVRKAFDVKINDVVLALVAGALRRYLQSRDELPSQPLIAQVPVSMRADGDSAVGTKVGAMFASLGTDIGDPALRLMTIHESTAGAKEMHRALAAEKIMGLTDTTPPGLIALAARMYTAAQLDRRTPPIMNLIVSNVPGPPFPLYTAGAKVESMYPMGPLLYGTGLNVTVFSYLDHMDFGFMSCRDVVSDGWFIAEGIGLALEELKDAAAKMAARS